MSQDEEYEQLGEQLSALADGELSREERAFLLRRLGRDGTARARLGRYFLMRDALQRTLPEQPDPGLAERVRARLADEPDHDSTSSAEARGAYALADWRRPAVGGVIAATVAAMTVLWWQGGAPPGVSREPSTAGSEPATEAPDPPRSTGSTVQPVTLGDRGSLTWPQQGPGPDTAGDQQAVTLPMPEVVPSRLERLTIDPAEGAEAGRSDNGAAYPPQ